jgi:DNA transposition AAA+ family ATPase
MEDTKLTGKNAPSALVAEVERVVAEQGWSGAAAARQIGVTAGAFSAWRNGTYGASSKGIDVKAEAFLQRMREISLQPSGDRCFRVVAETSVFRQVTEVVRQCHLYGEMGLVTSISGTGKTRVVEDYVAANPGSILVKCHPNFPAGAVLGEIARQAGIEVRGSVHVVLTAIWEKLAGSGKVIILNEAEHLKPGVLDVVRSIWDEARVGIVYVGIPRLAGLLRSLKGDYTYIWNRVSIKLEITRSKVDAVRDLETLLFANGYDEAFAQQLYEFCGGDIRLAESLFFKALSLARTAGEPMSGRAVEIVARQLELKAGGAR